MKKSVSLIFVLTLSLVLFGSVSFAAKKDKKVSSKKKANIEQKVTVQDSIKQDKALQLVLNAASAGDFDATKKIVEESNIDINLADENGTTILMKACCNTNLDLVKYLIEKKADITIVDKNNYNALMYAIEKSNLDIVRYLFEDSSVDIKQLTTDQMSLMSLAIKNPDFHIIQYLAEVQNFDLTLLDANGASLAMLAAGLGNMDIVKYLLDKRVEINIKDNNGNNILMYAVKSGNFDLVEYLVNSDSLDLNEKNNDNKTAKDIAIENNQTEIAKFLLQRV